jgi:RNA polymerase sigma-70 factor (ECF subfamily)
MGLVVHVANHTATARGIRLSEADREDLCAEVFLAIVRNNFALLRNFRAKSSLATYLTVVARRIVVKELLARVAAASSGDGTSSPVSDQIPDPGVSAEKRVADREELQRMLSGLQATEARVVQMYHLDGRTYREISSTVGVPENSIGPILSRAREKLRRGIDPATS